VLLRSLRHWAASCLPKPRAGSLGQSGAYTIGAANPRAQFHQMFHNVYHVITWGAALEGVGSRPFGSPGVPPILGVAHAIGLGLGVLAIGVGLVAIVRSVVGSIVGGDVPASDEVAGSDRREAAWFEDVLVFGFFGGCSTFVWFSFSSQAPFGRYLTAAMIFGSILGARLAGQIAGRATNGWPRIVLAGVAGLVVLGYATTFVNTLTTPSPAQPAVGLAAYLEQHHLTRGIGDYWSASIVTVESSDSLSSARSSRVPAVSMSCDTGGCRARHGTGEASSSSSTTRWRHGEASTRSQLWHRSGRRNT
jgi:hypothetical protein